MHEVGRSSGSNFIDKITIGAHRLIGNVAQEAKDSIMKLAKLRPNSDSVSTANGQKVAKDVWGRNTQINAKVHQMGAAKVLSQMAKDLKDQTNHMEHNRLRQGTRGMQGFVPQTKVTPQPNKTESKPEPSDAEKSRMHGKFQENNDFGI